MLIHEQKFFLSLAICEEAFWVRRRFCFYLFPLRRPPSKKKKKTFTLSPKATSLIFLFLTQTSWRMTIIWSGLLLERGGQPTNWLSMDKVPAPSPICKARGEGGSPVLHMCWGLFHGRGCAWRYLFLVAVCQQIFLTGTLPPGLSPETFKPATGI